MSEILSSPPATSSDTSTQGGRLPMRSAGLIATVPALLLLGLGFAFDGAPAARPITQALTAPSSSADGAVGVVPVSQTMVVAQNQSSGYSLLRGELRPVIRATGQAPMSGQISRVLVRAGQSVDVGDRVLQLSTGVTSRPPSGMENAQTEAEAAQVAAARQQDALQARIQKAHARLREAQLRVEAAQRGVAKARELVVRLRRDGSAPQEEPEVKTTAPAASSATLRAAEKARRDADAASREAERAANKAAAARRAADAAEAEAKQKKQKQADAEANVDKVQQQFEAKTAKGSDVEVARTAAADARSAASDAADKASAARAESEKLASTAQTLSGKAKQLAAQAQKQEQAVPEGARVAAATGRHRSTQAGARRSNTGNVSVEQAARIVSAAIAESDSAIKAADSLKRQVDSYERQARITQQKIDSSSTRLEAAQERVMEHTIQANLSSVRAPASGTVLWVAEIATEVSAGEKLITIAHPSMLEVQFRDYSNAWQQLKPGATLPAIVSTGAPSSVPGPNTAHFEPETGRGVARTAALKPGSLKPGLAAAVATTVRLRSITPPARPGGPALLRAVVYNPAAQTGNGGFVRQIKAGLPIACSILKPGSQSTLNIPVVAIREDDRGTPTVAVLSPIETVDTGDAVVESDEVYRIEWRAVKLGSGDGMQQQIAAGLQPGDRIALRPDELYAITLSHGPEATVRLETT